MRILLIMAVLSFSFSACGEVIRGNGNVTTQERTVADFNAISTSGTFEIVLAKGEPHLVIETDENLHDHIRTEVKGSKLIISSDDKHLHSKKLLVTVYYQSLEAVDVSGAAEISTNNVIESSQFSLDISGAAEANLELNVESFSIDLSGAGELTLRGHAGKASFDLSGASEVKASELVVDVADIEISGGSEMEIHVQNKLNVDISGAGEIKYTGDPEVSQSISGAGVLKKV